MGFKTIVICDNCDRQLAENEASAFVEAKSEIDGHDGPVTEWATAVWCLGCHGGRWPGIKHNINPKATE